MPTDANNVRVAVGLALAVPFDSGRASTRRCRVDLEFRNGVAYDSKKIVESLKGKVGR